MSQSHYQAWLILDGRSAKEKIAARKDARAKGFDPNKRFVYYDGNPKGQAVAKRECTAYAKEWSDKLGLGIEVCLGFDL